MTGKQQMLADRHLANMLAAMEIDLGVARGREVFQAAVMPIFASWVRGALQPNALRERIMAAFDDACSDAWHRPAPTLRAVPPPALRDIRGEMRALHDVIARRRDDDHVPPPCDGAA